MKSIVISKNEEGIKLLKFLKNIFKDMPDSLLHKLLRKKYFKINDKKANGSEILKTNDTLFIFFADETFDKFYNNHDKKHNEFATIKSIDEKLYIDNRIVYEDDNIIIYNKPCGLLSQSDKSGDLSVNDILYNYLLNKNEILQDDNNNTISKSLINSNLSNTYDFRPSIMNRLDRNTEGLIIFAKNYLSSRLISEMIRKNLIEKHYKTIVNGIVEKKTCELINLYKKDDKYNKAIIKDYAENYNDNEYSVVKLRYNTVKINDDSSILDVELITGKSHQIRAQLSHIGHPIICDKKYMNNKLYTSNVLKYGIKHQKLICYFLKFGQFNNTDLEYLSNNKFIINTDF